MSTQSPSKDAIKYFDIHDFTFQDGTRLPLIRLAYRDVNPDSSKIALVSTCFRGLIDATLNFSSGALRGYRVITVALLGNGESSSPSNTPDFPKALDYRDCVRAQHALLTVGLKAQSVDVIVGFSMGGQLAYHWIVEHPDFIRNAVIICSSARTSRHNYQFLEGPKAALENAVDYVGWDRKSSGAKPARGLRAFGKAYSAWLTSADWFEEERYKDMGPASQEAWDTAVGDGYMDWDADDLLSKLRMWQNGDITKCRAGSPSSLQESLAQIQARVLLMPCQTDQYFGWQANERELQHLRNGRLEVIPSIWGHIAGGGANPTDTKWMDQKIADFLAGTP